MLYSSRAFLRSILTLFSFAFGLNFEYFKNLKLILSVFCAFAGFSSVFFAIVEGSEDYHLKMANFILTQVAVAINIALETVLMTNIINWNTRSRSIMIGSIYFIADSFPMFIQCFS